MEYEYDDEDEGTYEEEYGEAIVVKILKRRIRKGDEEYLVEWSSTEEDSNDAKYSWESKSKLIERDQISLHLISEFERSNSALIHSNSALTNTEHTRRSLLPKTQLKPLPATVLLSSQST
jgi:hypothetical protein